MFEPLKESLGGGIKLANSARNQQHVLKLLVVLTKISMLHASRDATCWALETLRWIARRLFWEITLLITLL